MNEEELIQKLNKIDEIEPHNPMYFENLKKRLVNQHTMMLNSINKTETKPKEKKSFFNWTFMLGTLAISAVVVISLIMIFASDAFNQSKVKQNGSSKNDDIKKVEMNIGGKKISAKLYQPEDMFIEFALPEEWKQVEIENSSKNDNQIKYTNSNKELVVTALADYLVSELIPPNGIPIETNDKYSIYTLDTQNFELYDELSYMDNYLVTFAQNNTVLFYSEENDGDKIYLEGILESVVVSNPYDNWIFEESEEIGISLYRPDGWISQVSTDDGSLILKREFESTVSGSLVNSLQIKIQDVTGESIDTSDVIYKNVYGNIIQDDQESKPKTKTYYIDFSTKKYSVEYTPICDELVECEISDIDQNAIEKIYDQEVRFIISSIRFSYTKESLPEPNKYFSLIYPEFATVSSNAYEDSSVEGKLFETMIVLNPSNDDYIDTITIIVNNKDSESTELIENFKEDPTLDKLDSQIGGINCEKYYKYIDDNGVELYVETIIVENQDYYFQIYFKTDLKTSYYDYYLDILDSFQIK